MSTAQKIRVLVVDDSTFMRSLLSRLISNSPQFEVVGTAENGLLALEKIKLLQPDVVTLDVEMPELNGLEALKRIMRECPTPVVMISTLTEAGAKETMEALSLGAVDFMPKAIEDASRNIANQAKIIADKLMAASQARVGQAKPVVAMPTVVPAATTGAVAPKQVRTPKPMTRLVVVGSSTGGPKALESIIPQLPASLRVPMLVAQHMPAHFTQALAQRLNALSPLTVVEAKAGDVLQPGHVYIAPGGMHMTVVDSQGKLMVEIKADAGESYYRPSVDVLAESALKACQGQVLGVMLTGMGQDGAKAFKQLRDKGAYVVAQDEPTSVVYGMPRAVKEIAGADEVLPLGEIAQAIKVVVQ